MRPIENLTEFSMMINEDIYWYYLFDYNRNIKNDFEASSRAALKFRQAIPITLVIQFEDLISFISKNLLIILKQKD